MITDNLLKDGKAVAMPVQQALVTKIHLRLGGNELIELLLFFVCSVFENTKFK